MGRKVQYIKASLPGIILENSVSKKREDAAPLFHPVETYLMVHASVEDQQAPSAKIALYLLYSGVMGKIKCAF